MYTHIYIYTHVYIYIYVCIYIYVRVLLYQTSFMPVPRSNSHARPRFDGEHGDSAQVLHPEAAGAGHKQAWVWLPSELLAGPG